MLLSKLHGACMVRFIAFSSSSPAQAAFLSALLVGPSLFLFIHLLNPLPLVPPYWVWAYYADPMQWATTMVMSSEFLSGQFGMTCGQALGSSEVTPSQVFFCTGSNANETVGEVRSVRVLQLTYRSYTMSACPQCGLHTCRMLHG